MSTSVHVCTDCLEQGRVDPIIQYPAATLARNPPFFPRPLQILAGVRSTHHSCSCLFHAYAQKTFWIKSWDTVRMYTKDHAGAILLHGTAISIEIMGVILNIMTMEH